MEYPQHFTEHLRIAVLRLLAELPGYRANSSILADGVTALGLTTSRDRMKTELAWLAEQGLVTASNLDRLVVAVLTDRGLEVSQGIVRVPGVKAPAP